MTTEINQGAPAIPPARPFLAHTPPIELGPEAPFNGLMACLALTKHRCVSVMGLAIPTAVELDSLLKDVLPDAAIRILEQESVLKEDDFTILLLRITGSLVTDVPGTVLILTLDPQSLQAFVETPGLTDIVYVARTQSDLEAYLSLYPESRAVCLFPETIPSAELTDVYERRRQWFQEHYAVIAGDAFGPESKTKYLGKPTERVCRYCGESESKVPFKNKAHAFPEQIGNKALVDWEECDHCNTHFSKWVEDDFAKWTHPVRTMGRVTGKGIPSLKSSDKGFRVDADNPRSITIRLGIDDPRHHLDEDNNTVTLQLERQPYTPMGVFKCMVKMALAVMPEAEAALCKHLKEWILLENHTFESYRYKPLHLFIQQLPGLLPNDRFQYVLLRRNAERKDCPFLVFVLQFSNVVYQIALPMHREDEALIEAGKFDLPFFPHIGGTKEHESKYGQTIERVLDMSGTNAVRGEHETMSFHFDRLINLPVEPDIT